VTTNRASLSRARASNARSNGERIFTGRYRNPLAVDGGEPIRIESFPHWPSFSNEEIRAAVAVLQSGKVNYWTGEECQQFEKEYAMFTGSEHAIAVCNGTVSLELALYAMEIGPGDEVIVPSRTFIASASSVIMRGATPVIVDIDRDSQTLTADTIRPALTPRTKAVIAVHLAGWPCDMDPILILGKEHGFRVIEDCAQALGAAYKDRTVGSIGHIGSFSFCQDKIMTTGGEGGMLTTDDIQMWERSWSFKDHGKNFHKVRCREKEVGFNFVHDCFGTNWRLTEMQASIGRVLLRKIADQVEKRRSNAAILSQLFARIPSLRVTIPPLDVHHSYYKYYVFLCPEMLRPNWDQKRVIKAISAEGVPCFSGTCSEIYLETAFPNALRPPERLPIARELGETSLMFLVHPTLGEREMVETYNAVEKVMEAATI
jgi:dTDP-4-amino-4,6-dideoxygalactose transaminase